MPGSAKNKNKNMKRQRTTHKHTKFFFVFYSHDVCVNGKQSGLWATWLFIRNSCCAPELKIRLQAKNEQAKKHSQSNSYSVFISTTQPTRERYEFVNIILFSVTSKMKNQKKKKKRLWCACNLTQMSIFTLVHDFQVWNCLPNSKGSNEYIKIKRT